VPANDITLLERFWSKVDKTPGFGKWGDCWRWTAFCDRDGYGKFAPRHGEQWYAHRWIYEQTTGNKLGKRLATHKCDTPSCVRPDHIEPGNQKKNMGECSQRKRISHGERHYCAKLTAEQVREIRTDPRLHREIAEDYGVARAMVTRIKGGKRWRLVE